MIHHNRFYLLLSCAMFAYASSAAGQEVLAVRPDASTSLESLGERIHAWPSLSDNVFLHAAERIKIIESAQPLMGTRITFVAMVEKVTQQEVYLDVPNVGRTRIVVRHGDCPLFGNLGSVGYCGPRSAGLAYLLSKQLALRIGAEIEFDTAKELRRDDRLEIRGDIEMVHLLLDDFEPRAIAVIGNVEARRDPGPPSRYEISE